MELTKKQFVVILDEQLKKRFAEQDKRWGEQDKRWAEQEKRFVEHRKESERYAGAILEEFQSRFAAFTEQFKDLPETVAAIRDKLDRTDEKVDMIYSIVMTELPTKVDREEFVGLKRRVSVLERRS